LRDIGEARISLDEVPPLASERAPSLAAVGRAGARRWLWLVSGIAGLLLLATVLLALLYLRQQPAVAVARNTRSTAPRRFGRREWSSILVAGQPLYRILRSRQA
jgi:hypothetical protein